VPVSIAKLLHAKKTDGTFVKLKTKEENVNGIDKSGSENKETKKEVLAGARSAGI